jgi:hypothetical protein
MVNLNIAPKDGEDAHLMLWYNEITEPNGRGDKADRNAGPASMKHISTESFYRAEKT